MLIATDLPMLKSINLTTVVRYMQLYALAVPKQGRDDTQYLLSIPERSPWLQTRLKAKRTKVI